MDDKDTNVPNKTEYISREAVFDWFCESADIDGCVDLPKNNGSCKQGCRLCISGKELDEIPTADVRPVVYGRWIESTELSEQVKGKKFCSNCGKAQYCIEITDNTIQIKSGTSKFCPECGARMEET